MGQEENAAGKHSAPEEESAELKAYKALVEEQVQGLMSALQSVAVGNLDVEVEIPEGVEALSDLAVGIEIMIDDLRATMAQQVRLQLVEAQSRALLDVVQSVALGDLDVEVDIPEGVEVLSELAVGLDMMLDDLRETTAEQQRAHRELEDSRRQLEQALQEMLAVQGRYLHQEWESYVSAAKGDLALGYVRDAALAADTDALPEGAALLPADAWLPGMDLAVQEGRVVSEVDAPGQEATLALPLQLYGEVIGVMGFSRPEGEPWDEDEIRAVELVAEQLSMALESQRLFDEEQQSRAEMELLLRLTQRLIELDDEQEMFEYVLTQYLGFLGLPQGGVLLTDPVPPTEDGAAKGNGDTARSIPLTGTFEAAVREGQLVGALTEELTAEGAPPRQIPIAGNPVMEQLMLTKKPVIIEDTLQSDLVAPVPEVQAALGYRSLLLVPILVRGEVIGALGADSTQEVYPFTEREVALVQAVADQLAIALENRRLLESTESALAEAQALYDATRMVAALAGLEETLQFVVQGVARALPADQVALYALDVEREEVTHFVGFAAPAEEAGSPGALRMPPVERLSFDELMGGLTGWILREGEPALSTKSRPDPREGQEQQERRLRNEAGAIVVVPVRYGDKVLGTLTAVNHVDSPDFGQRDVDLMAAMGNQAAVALENARLFEETQIRAREQMVLNEVGQLLAACQDVAGVLDEVYAGAVRLLRAGAEVGARSEEVARGYLGDQGTGFYITLYDEASQEITMALQVVDGQVRRPWTPVPRAGGLSEHLILSRQPLLLTDRPLERVKELGITALPLLGDRSSASWLGVPIMLGDQVLGTMVALDFERERVYDERSEDLLLALANRTALSLQNVRLLAETRAALEEVEALHRSYLRRGWQEYLRQQALLEESAFVYDSVAALTRDAAALAEGTAVLAEGADPVTDGTPAPRGLPSGDRAVAVPDFWRPEMEQALRGSAARQAGPEGTGTEDVPSREEADEHRGLAVPILLRGQTLGVLGIEAPADGREWTEEDRALIEAVGEQLAQTLESARLFAETQRRAERERLVGEISARIRASTDIRDILETTAVELGRALGTSRALVRLVAEGEEDNEVQGYSDDVQGALG